MSDEGAYDVASAACELCGRVEPAIEVSRADEIRERFPAYNLDVPNARYCVSGAYALLHHICQSPQADTDTPWWDEARSWWACQQPLRALDADAHFDINCPDCAVRWAQTL